MYIYTYKGFDILPCELQVPEIRGHYWNFCYFTFSTEWLSWSHGQKTINTILSVFRGFAVYTIGFQCFRSPGIVAYTVKEVDEIVLVHQVVSHWPEIIQVSHKALGKRSFACEIK